VPSTPAVAQRNNPLGFADPVEGRGDEFGGLGALVGPLRATVDALHALKPRVPE
jgi:hypothetical protein